MLDLWLKCALEKERSVFDGRLTSLRCRLKVRSVWLRRVADTELHTRAGKIICAIRSAVVGDGPSGEVVKLLTICKVLGLLSTVVPNSVAIKRFEAKLENDVLRDPRLHALHQARLAKKSERPTTTEAQEQARWEEGHRQAQWS